VDFVLQPGEPQLVVRTGSHGPRGCFVYQSFNTQETGTDVNLRIVFDQVSAEDGNWPYQPYCAAWDRVAITNAKHFQPPRMAKHTASQEPKEQPK
jgi:hypothetical protein